MHSDQLFEARVVQHIVIDLIHTASEVKSEGDVNVASDQIRE